MTRTLGEYGMSRAWRVAVVVAQLVFAVAFVAGLYVDLMMLAPRLPDLSLPAIATAARDANAREDRAPAAGPARQGPSVETPPPPAPPPPPPVAVVTRASESTESASETPTAAQKAVMAAPIERITSPTFVEVSRGRGHAKATASRNPHALAAHARHDSAPPPKGHLPHK